MFAVLTFLLAGKVLGLLLLLTLVLALAGWMMSGTDGFLMWLFRYEFCVKPLLEVAVLLLAELLNAIAEAGQ